MLSQNDLHRVPVTTARLIMEYSIKPFLNLHQASSFWFILKTLIAILHFCLLSSFFSMLCGQSYLVHKYNENDGISSSQVNDVKQDSSGRLWFATRAGISVYDGNTWLEYNRADGLPASSYFRIEIDANGIVWILSSDRHLYVSWLDQNKWNHIPPPSEIPVQIIFTCFKVFYFQDQRYIYLGTYRSGLLCYSNGVWQQVFSDEKFRNIQINSIIEVRGKLYIATNKGIFVVSGLELQQVLVFNKENRNQTFRVNYTQFTKDKDLGDFFRLSPDKALSNKQDEKMRMADLNQLKSIEIKGLALEESLPGQKKTSKIWIHGGHWVGYIQDDQFYLFSEKAKSETDLAHSFVLLQPDDHGGIFWGNIYDVYYLQQKNGFAVRLGRKNGLISEGVTSFLIDREKNIWMTSFRGISKIPNMRFKNYAKTDGLFEDEVTAICEMDSGKFIFGHGDGLTFYDGQNYKVQSFTTNEQVSEFKTRVLDIKKDSQGTVWIAASRLGLGKILNNNRIKWYSIQSRAQDFVSSIFEVAPGELWVADYKGLFRFENETFFPITPSIFRLNSEKAFLDLRKIYQGPHHSVFLATSGNGIYFYQDQKWSRFYHENNSNINDVYSIFTDSQNRVWVGTAAGLFFLDIKSRRFLELFDFSLTRPVYLIFEDRKQRIWFGTDNGVFRWDGIALRRFQVEDGFVGQETNRAAGIVDHEDRVWIGCDLGVSCYQEEYDTDDIPPPNVELRYLDVGDDTLALNDEIKLSAGKKIFNFHFIGISFIDKKSVSYRVKLDGFDDDWTLYPSLERPVIKYTNLPPGSYQFMIQAKSKRSDWSHIISSAKIIIPTPILKSWWFRTLIAVGVFLIFLSFFLIWVVHLKKQDNLRKYYSQRVVEETENRKKRIAAELHDSIGQSLLVTINRLKQFILVNRLSKKYVDDIQETIEIVADSIDEIRDISSDLHPHILERLGLTKAIQAMIEKIDHSYDIQFHIDIDEIDQLFPKQLQIHLYRLVQEGLNNIIKHSGAGNAYITLKQSNLKVAMTIKDDGKGFNYKKYPDNHLHRFGLGLVDISERIRILEGRLKIVSAPGKGTTLSILIPVPDQQYDLL